MNLSNKAWCVISVLSAVLALPSQAAPSSTERVGPVAKPAPRVKAFMPGATTLLVQDVRPWDSAANEEILTNLGVTYDVVGSAGLADVPLARYSTLIISSDQPQAFYDALAAQTNAVSRWLKKGNKTLSFHGAPSGWQSGDWTFALPGGTTHQIAYDGTNMVSQANHPLVAGAPQMILGSSASHANFVPGPKLGSDAIVATDTTGAPTLLDYCVGTSRVMATGMTLEIAYAYNWDARPILVNMLTAGTQAPGCPQERR